MSQGSYLGGSSIVRVKVESSKGLKTFLDRMRNKNNKLSDTEYELKLERIVESMGITQRSVRKKSRPKENLSTEAGKVLSINLKLKKGIQRIFRIKY